MVRKECSTENCQCLVHRGRKWPGEMSPYLCSSYKSFLQTPSEMSVGLGMKLWPDGMCSSIKQYLFYNNNNNSWYHPIESILWQNWGIERGVEANLGLIFFCLFSVLWPWLHEWLWLALHSCLFCCSEQDVLLHWEWNKAYRGSTSWSFPHLSFLLCSINLFIIIVKVNYSQAVLLCWCFASLDNDFFFF